jgi:ABC-type nitrate/sulfonate/bicarbonate transport system permease component
MKFKRRLFIFVIFIFLWHLLSLLVARPLLPRPLETFSALFELIKKGEIWGHFLISLYRVVLSLLIALALALPLGILIGYKEKLYQALYPLVTALYPMPKVVFLPVLVLFFGLGNLSKIVLISLILFFQIELSIIDSVRSIPRDTFTSMYLLSQSFKDILRHLILPYILPDILTAVRISIGTAISVLFFSETFASFDGLGYFILDTMGRREYKEMYATIIIMSLMGLVLYKLVYIIEKKTCHRKGKNT